MDANQALRFVQTALREKDEEIEKLKAQLHEVSLNALVLTDVVDAYYRSSSYSMHMQGGIKKIITVDAAISQMRKVLDANVT